MQPTGGWPGLRPGAVRGRAERRFVRARHEGPQLMRKSLGCTRQPSVSGRMSLQSWLQLKAIAWHTTQSTVRGDPVTVINTRPDIETADVLARLDLRGVERRRFVGFVGVPEVGRNLGSSSPPSRCSFEHVVEAGVAMLHAVGHARGDGAITRFLRRERQIADERRDAVLLTEFK